MGDVRHRIGLGTVGGSSLSGKNNIASGALLDTSAILTADNTFIKASTTISTADASFLFTADSTRFNASGTIY
jgi:hypothetical protein